ncbi:MAG: hypothetical protein NUV65_03560 [Candidatus Roizmanbacteria bacterium]|nr:hypothetical protein [Candidatus Roizmanbacteria bacterium]
MKVKQEGNHLIITKEKKDVWETGDKITVELDKFVADEHRRVLSEVEGWLVEIGTKKFPIGERSWCIECSSRITKELRAKLAELKGKE